MNQRRKTALIVDDETSFLMSVEDGLRRYLDAIEIITAGDGLQALREIESHRPELVVSDMRMPGMDGIELLLTCRKRYPRLPIILVSAYFSVELERSARSFGAAAVLHKPLDLRTLAETMGRVLADQERLGSDGYLANFSLPSFLQLLAMERKSCTLSIHGGSGHRGQLWVLDGHLIDAVQGSASGLDAALAVLAWDDVDIMLGPPNETHPVRITEGINFLLMEAARLRDEAAEGSHRADGTSNDSIEDAWDGAFIEPPASAGNEAHAHAHDSAIERALRELARPIIAEPDKIEVPRPATAREHAATARVGRPISKEKTMASMEETMTALKDLNGFVAVGVFAPDGEMLAEISTSGTQLAELGALANDVLLKAQKSTDIMGVGRGNMVHITAPRANILVRCLNENTDFAANTVGRAHLHMVLVLEAEANVALGKIQLSKVIQEVAPMVR